MLTIRGLQKQLAASEELVGNTLEHFTDRLEALRGPPIGSIAVADLLGVLDGFSLGMPDTALSALLSTSGVAPRRSVGTNGVVSLTRALQGFRPGPWDAIFEVHSGRLQRVSLFCREGPAGTRAELEAWLRGKFGTPRRIADETEGLPEDLQQFLRDEDQLIWTVPLSAVAVAQVGLRGAGGDASVFAALALPR